MQKLLEVRKITIKECAKLMGKSEMFVRIGLQRGLLKIGTAFKIEGNNKYSYHISPKLLNDYLGTHINCSIQEDSNHNIIDS
jgi:hypothetical protein